METLVKPDGNLFPAIPSLIEDFFLRDFFDNSNAYWRPGSTTLPAVNVLETNDEFTIEVAAPGMRREDFHVELDNNTLTISSTREEKKQEKDSDLFSRREFNYQAFQRIFSLPENKIVGENISARYTDGILYISVLKKEGAKVKPPKQISIS